MFQGHESTIMLNKAYKVLVRDDLRREYDKSIGQIRVGIDRSMFGSVWKEPLRPQALFVDENACVGKWQVACFCFLLATRINQKSRRVVWKPSDDQGLEFP